MKFNINDKVICFNNLNKVKIVGVISQVTVWTKSDYIVTDTDGKSTGSWDEQFIHKYCEPINILKEIL